MSGRRPVRWGESRQNPTGSGRNYNVRRERVKQDVPITELLHKLDIAAGPRMKNGHPTYHCPFHADTNPSLEVAADDRTWTCWPCGLKMRDAITLVQMLLFPESNPSDRSPGWFDKTLSHIEELFGLGDIDPKASLKVAAELRAMRERQIVSSRERRVATRAIARSNRFRLELARVVRKAWGDQMAQRSREIVALYGHLEYLLAAGRDVADSDQYNDWRARVSTWVDNVRRKIRRPG